MYFYTRLSLLELGITPETSIGIVPHNFHSNIESSLKNGIYNVGFIYFNNDQNALDCLNDWRFNCLKSTSDIAEDSVFGDQKYLDEWPSKFRSLIIITHPGVNLAPWNITNYNITRFNDANYLVDNYPLICFHFHGLRNYFFRKVYLFTYTSKTISSMFAIRKFISMYISEISNIDNGLTFKSQRILLSNLSFIDEIYKFLKNIIRGRVFLTK